MVSGGVVKPFETALENLLGKQVVDCGFTAVPNCLQLVWHEARVRDVNEETGEIARERELSSTARLVALTLLSHAYPGTRKKDPYSVWPSHKTLALETACSERQVKQALADLRAAKLIRRRKERVDSVKPDFKPNGHDLLPLIERMREAATRYQTWHEHGVAKAREENKERIAIKGNRKRGG